MLFVVMELMPVVFARHEVFLAVELERVVSVEHFVPVRENEKAARSRKRQRRLAGEFAKILGKALRDDDAPSGPAVDFMLAHKRRHRRPRVRAGVEQHGRNPVPMREARRVKAPEARAEDGPVSPDARDEVFEQTVRRLGRPRQVGRVDAPAETPEVPLRRDGLARKGRGAKAVQKENRALHDASPRPSSSRL